MDFPDYDELDHALRAAAVDLSAAEAHGMIAAAASVPQPPALARLLFGGAAAPADADSQELMALATALFDDVRRRLAETDFEFEPLLGDAELPMQVERLAEWARGYVLGLGLAGIGEARPLPGEAGEFVRDAMQIGEVEMDRGIDTEQQEREVAEIVEYLRVGVQLVYEQMHRNAS
ncbi:MAG: UPF0149 family protein [Sulfurifustis sp.]